MRRSTLQRKDRDELTQIATTLGKKPSSRARKGEIIDLILDLAAGGDGSGAAEATQPTAADGSADEAEEAATADAGADDTNATGDAAGDEPEPAPVEATKGRGRADGAKTDDSSDDDQPGDGDNRPEPGNRRRRRRGRDRDSRSESNEQWDGDPIPVEGRLDLRSEGYGFLRVNGYIPSRDDAYVPVKLVRQYGLRKGDVVAGPSRPANRNEKNPALISVEAVNGGDVGAAGDRPEFDALTPLYPDERLRMEMKADRSNMTARIIDLVAPIGKGQRGLIVSPPKAGKTSVMKQIIRSVEANHPEVYVMVLLIDERPEEVTDMRRWMKGDGEVVASTFDRPTDEHVHIADLAIERAKRLVEEGRDVLVMVDGITRLTRAYNLETQPSNKTLSGGVDAAALYGPKRFFGAARNVEEGGSLTILATALVETGSRMDEVIFEEFKGTGNMELRLDRRLAERRVYPAIDIDGSSTRHEELLFDKKQLDQVWKLRRVLGALADEKGAAAGLEMLMNRLEEFKTNDEFLAEVASSASSS
ncbi:MAG: transcription termination factor Rho [Actinomycetota bacterium]